MIVCLSIPNISVYGEEDSSAYSGITNDIVFISKKYISNENCKNVTYNFPTNSGFKSFMFYTAITDISSMQYELQTNLAYTGHFGIRQIDNRYCVAIDSAFDVDIGTYIDLILENGNVIQCIVGDIKSPNDTLENNITTVENGCVSEFIVDINSLKLNIKRDGDISSCQMEWDSPVEALRVYDKNILK